MSLFPRPRLIWFTEETPLRTFTALQERIQASVCQSRLLSAAPFFFPLFFALNFFQHWHPKKTTLNTPFNFFRCLLPHEFRLYNWGISIAMYVRELWRNNGYRRNHYISSPGAVKTEMHSEIKLGLSPLALIRVRSYRHIMTSGYSRLTLCVIGNRSTWHCERC